MFKKEDLESFIEHSNTKGCHKVSTLIFSNSIRLSRDRLSKENRRNKQGIRRKARISWKLPFKGLYWSLDRFNIQIKAYCIYRHWYHAVIRFLYLDFKFGWFGFWFWFDPRYFSINYKFLWICDNRHMLYDFQWKLNLNSWFQYEITFRT